MWLGFKGTQVGPLTLHIHGTPTAVLACAPPRTLMSGGCKRADRHTCIAVCFDNTLCYELCVTALLSAKWSAREQGFGYQVHACRRQNMLVCINYLWLLLRWVHHELVHSLPENPARLSNM